MLSSIMNSVEGSLPPTLILPHKWGGNLHLFIEFVTGLVDPTGSPINANKAAINTPIRKYSVLLGITKIPVGRIGKGFSAEIGNQ